MAKTSRTASRRIKHQTPVAKSRARATPAKSAAPTRAAADTGRGSWATDLVFDVREPKLAVSLRLDADVLRFFRGFGSGYQTRINEVLKAFMQARGGPEATSAARSTRGSTGNGKRATR